MARPAAWIDEYNRDRKHSAWDMRSPIDYELALPAAPERDAVLADVKAKPSGWPPASLDTGCGRRPSAPVRGRPEGTSTVKIPH